MNLSNYSPQRDDCQTVHKKTSQSELLPISSHGISLPRQMSSSTFQLAPLQVTGTQIQRNEVLRPSSKYLYFKTANSLTQLPQLRPRVPLLKRICSLDLPDVSTQWSTSVPNPRDASESRKDVTHTKENFLMRRSYSLKLDLSDASCSNVEGKRVTFSEDCLSFANLKLSVKDRQRPVSKSFLPLLQKNSNTCKSFVPESVIDESQTNDSEYFLSDPENSQTFKNSSSGHDRNNEYQKQSYHKQQLSTLPANHNHSELQLESHLPKDVNVTCTSEVESEYRSETVSCSDCIDLLDSISEKFARNALNQAIKLLHVRKMFYKTWPDVMRDVVEEILIDFQDMESHIETCMQELDSNSQRILDV